MPIPKVTNESVASGWPRLAVGSYRYRFPVSVKRLSVRRVV